MALTWSFFISVLKEINKRSCEWDIIKCMILFKRKNVMNSRRYALTLFSIAVQYIFKMYYYTLLGLDSGANLYD